MVSLVEAGVALILSEFVFDPVLFRGLIVTTVQLLSNSTFGGNRQGDAVTGAITS